MGDLPEAVAYDVPHWDCPVCGGVNGLFGQDDAAGAQDCSDWGGHSPGNRIATTRSQPP